MAIYHLSCQIIGRINKKTGNIRSTIACAAYRSGEQLEDKRTNDIKKYSRNIAPKTYLLAPAGSPEWATDRETLWNKVEETEKAYNAQLAREFNIALPLELSESAQEKLVIDYCNENFVNRGMIADISIHRDHKNNPHFHVMLPLREASETGFKSKCKKEYILDQNGNKIKNKNGEYKSRRVDLNDWNKKENIYTWRKNWEIMTNKYLESNGIDERVSCESYAELGSDKIATLHEGVHVNAMEKAGKNTEIRKKNNQIKLYNKCITDIAEYKKQREIKHCEYIKRYFEKDDIEVLRQISKKTKTYINYENIKKRRNQLINWEKALNFAKENNLEKLNRIRIEEEYLKEAEAILMHEANLFIEANYPEIKYQLSPEEKMELVNACVNRKKLFTQEELKDQIIDIRERMLRTEIKHIVSVKKQYGFYLMKKIDNYEKYISEVVKKYGADMTRPESAKLLPSSVIESLRRTNQSIHKYRKALRIIDKIYDLEIDRMYPNWKERKNLNIMEKEVLIASEKYYGYRLQPEQIREGVIDQKYSTDEQIKIIDYLTDLDIEKHSEFKKEFKDFDEDSSVYKYIFFTECMSNIKLSQEYKVKIEELVMPSIYIPEKYQLEKNIITRYNSENENITSGNSILAQMIIQIIKETLIDDITKDKKAQMKKYGKYSKKHRRLS